MALLILTHGQEDRPSRFCHFTGGETEVQGVLTTLENSWAAWNLALLGPESILKSGAKRNLVSALPVPLENHLVLCNATVMLHACQLLLST